MENQVRHMPLPVETFSPCVLYSSMETEGFSFPKGYRYPERYVYDYELELITCGEGAMYIDDRLYPVDKGDIVFRRPGQSTQGIPPYTSYLLSIDLTGNIKDPGTYAFCGTAPGTFQPYYENPLLDAIPVVFRPYPYEKYLRLFDEINREFTSASGASSLFIKSYALQLLAELIRDSGDAAKYVPASPYGKIIRSVLDHIRGHITDNLSLTALSQVAGLCPTYFHKVFTGAIGISPNEYVTRFRMELAKELLIGTDTPVYRVGQAVGIENAPYFSAVFKKRSGLSPEAYRRRAQAS